ncbi:MAG TPA: 5'/3'-nucleotidase SurE [Gemmatimonadaceae bacterium]|nr:5'/3'-nucleotidase SurE [Gemmatimonadaceae bacterium]
MKARLFRPALVMALASVMIAATRVEPQAAPAGFPARVLITNDNGIDDPKIVALARAFARHAETWVVAPAADRSGSGSYLTVTKTGMLSVERRDLGAGIRAFAVDGYPADCVVLALLGLMKDSLPDLVISGINGGANLGADWFGSGTIGAARIAALAGIPAIAVSGLDDDLPGAVEAAVDWVVRLAASSVVQSLDPPDYLTVSLPRLSPDQIRGVRVTDRAPLRVVPQLRAVNATTWRVVGTDEIAAPAPADSDQAMWEQGYIVVVPMRADEIDFERLVRWRRDGVGLPAWRADGQ